MALCAIEKRTLWKYLPFSLSVCSGSSWQTKRSDYQINVRVCPLGVEYCCFCRGTCQNMNIQKNLMDKGAKVELGIPYELWDEPSVEVADLKRQVILMH
ncbi:hypothetical protein cypCar_00005446 [Cyprinus carpio]|nr:hypothetical protein cypCar_00005446 [Cyprinus carpio]